MGITAEFELLKKMQEEFLFIEILVTGYLTPIFRRRGFTFELLKNQNKFQEEEKSKIKVFLRLKDPF